MFDVSLEILEDAINKEDKLKAQVNLTPFGERGGDVTLKYLIKDFNGKIYYEESGTFYVDKEMSFFKEFSTDKLKIGDYVLGVEMTYTGGFASASSIFSVSEAEEEIASQPAENFKGYWIIAVILILLAVVLLLWKIKKPKKSEINLKQEKINSLKKRKQEILFSETYFLV